ncbi:MAG: hypothetical protein U0X75_18325 [Acidobacteriota bacterium]
MRAYLPEYELKTPANLAEALRLFSDEPGVWRPFAGGTDLMVLLEAGKLTHTRFVSLWGLPELTGICFSRRSDHHRSVDDVLPPNGARRLARGVSLLCEAASWTWRRGADSKIVARWAATSPMLRRRLIPCPRCWFTTRKPN